MSLSESSRQAIAVNKAHHWDRARAACCVIVFATVAVLVAMPVLIVGVHHLATEIAPRAMTVTVKMVAP